MRRYQKVKPIWILLKQHTVSGSGISWAVCKSAPRSRQITMLAPHHSVFTDRLPFLPPNQQRQSTEGSPRGHFGRARSVRLFVPWRSIGYRHAGCLQLSHRRPPEMCGLRTRPRTDVNPPRFLDRTAMRPGRHLFNYTYSVGRNNATSVSVSVSVCLSLLSTTATRGSHTRVLPPGTLCPTTSAPWLILSSLGSNQTILVKFLTILLIFVF